MKPAKRLTPHQRFLKDAKKRATSVRKLRKKGLKYRQIAARVGLSEIRVSQICRGVDANWWRKENRGY